MRVVEKRLRQRLKMAADEIADLRRELEKVREDRNKFRDHFVKRFQWWVKLMGDSSSPSLPWLIEDEAKWLQKFIWWPW